MTESGRRTALVICALLAAGCGPAPSARLTFSEIDSPAGPGSVTPSWTQSPDGEVYLSWVASEGDEAGRLMFARRRNGTWSPPGEVASGAHWFINWADFPAMVALGRGRLVAHWLERSGPGTYNYDIQTALSDDGGRHWRALGPLHDDGTRSEHGFVSYYRVSSGAKVQGTGVVWLDGRRTAAHGASGSHGAGAAMTLRHARISTEGRVTDRSELDARVCDCCQTAAVAVSDDVLVAYRDRSADEIRDIRLLRLTEGQWQDQGLVYPDQWQISACPVNGPAMSALGQRVAVAWFTAAGDRPTVKLALSDDGGRHFRVHDIEAGEVLGRVDVVLTSRGGAMTWMGGSGAASFIRLQQIGADGKPYAEPVSLTETSGVRRAGFPRLTSLDGVLLLAWTDALAEQPRVRVARIEGDF